MCPQDTMIPIGLCQCGCGQTTRVSLQNHRRYGWVKGQPLRFARGHHLVCPAARPLAERIWQAVERRGPEECWPAHRGLTQLGYSTLRGADGRKHPTHVLVYELLVGPVPTGLELDHLCRNHPCCNPAHLEPVTHRENMRRGHNGVKTRCPSGHPYDAANTILYDGRRYCRACKNADQRRRKAARRA